MTCDLDKSVKEILNDIKVRQSNAIKIAHFVDNLTIFFFYFWIVWFLVEKEWMIALALFAVKTLWGISMALQNIIKILNVSAIFTLTKLKE